MKITEFLDKKGRYFFGTVKVGERGQIVLPLQARKIFEIHAKDDAYIFGAINRGLGLTTKLKVSEEILEGNEQYFGISKVGERGQIVIPQKARELFKINPGDLILVFGHIEKGIGFVKASKLKDFAVKLFQAFGGFKGIQNNNGSDQNEEE